MRTQACRGAIRFNEFLNYQECSELIKALTNCKCRFRCAHGRVSVKPLLYLQCNNQQTTLASNLSKKFACNFPNIKFNYEQKWSNSTRKSNGEK